MMHPIKGTGRVALTSQPKSIYVYRNTRQPHAGAMSYAFIRRWADPVQYVYANGIPSGALQITSAPMMVQPATVQAGLGGIVAGQIMLQPLIVQQNNGG